MKKLILMFTVIMITLTVNAQEDTHVKVYKSVSLEEGAYKTFTQKESFTYHLDRNNSILRIVKGGETVYLQYTPHEYLVEDGYTSMIGYAVESKSDEVMVIEIGFSDITKNLVRLTLGNGEIYSSYFGYAY